MQALDVPVMAAQLNALAEVFDKKPVSEKASMVWFDTLKDFKTEKVCSILIAWPKTHTKFPSPADVFKVCNEAASSEMEAKAQRDNRQEVTWEKSPRAMEFMAKMKATLKKPKPDPIEHWKHTYATQPKGSIGYRYAEEALKKKNAFVVDREPGSDDEELAA